MPGNTTRTPQAVGELPEIQELPNPFAFADGSLVRNREDWQRRRKQLKALFEDYEYGHLPPTPERMTITQGEAIVDEETGARIQDLTLDFQHSGRTLVMHVRL